MTDNRLKGRVKGLFAGAANEGELVDRAPAEFDSDSERQALQVLVLARRTADEHVTTAHREAASILAEARSSAEQVGRDAQSAVERARHEAEKIRTDARSAAEQLSREARTHSEKVRREGDQALVEARKQAQEIVAKAQSHADELDRDAQQRFEDVVGTLESQRAALEQDIEALKQFDRTYRLRLASFMQGQLDALGLDELEKEELAQAHADDAPEEAETATAK